MAEGWPKRRTISLSGVRGRFGPVANAAWMKVKFLWDLDTDLIVIGSPNEGSLMGDDTTCNAAPYGK